MDAYIGEIRIFGGNFPPRDWAFCNGVLMSVQQYSALFSVLGTAYGGDGIRTFALPNLQGSVPMGAGAGPGLTPRSLGDTGGSTSVQLTTATMPAHNHGVACSNTSGNSPAPTGNFPAASDQNRTTKIYSDTPYSLGPSGLLNPLALMPTGGSNGNALAHNNMMPYMAVNFIICLSGIYPTPP